MRYRYIFTQSAYRQLQRLLKDVQRRIVKKLDTIIVSVDPFEYVNRLINSDIGTYRFRIGDYRVVFDLEEEAIVILAIGHRKDIYR